jgi:hypothetical protein
MRLTICIVSFRVDQQAPPLRALGPVEVADQLWIGHHLAHPGMAQALGLEDADILCGAAGSAASPVSCSLTP